MVTHFFISYLTELCKWINSQFILSSLMKQISVRKHLIKMWLLPLQHYYKDTKAVLIHMFLELSLGYIIGIPLKDFYLRCSLPKFKLPLNKASIREDSLILVYILFLPCELSSMLKIGKTREKRDGFFHIIL